MMNRHQIGYIYEELVELWKANLNLHIESVKNTDEYKELYEAFNDTKNGKTEAKYRADRIKTIIIVGDIKEKLTKLDKNYNIGCDTGYSQHRSSIDYEAIDYLKDKDEFVKEWNKYTESALENACNFYALGELNLHNTYNFTNYANTEIKSRLALIPIGDHDNIVKTILEEVTVEKVIEFVNA